MSELYISQFWCWRWWFVIYDDDNGDTDGDDDGDDNYAEAGEGPPSEEINLNWLEEVKNQSRRGSHGIWDEEDDKVIFQKLMRRNEKYDKVIFQSWWEQPSCELAEDKVLLPLIHLMDQEAASSGELLIIVIT